ncbi:MAG: M24 family metallopeptidase [Gemmatimonadales bacterium]
MVDRRNERQAAVIAVVESRTEGVLITSIPNIRWLTGFSGSAAMLLFVRGRAALITDFRYATQATAEVGGAAEVVIERASVWDRLKRLLDDAAIATLAFESHVTTVANAERLGSLFRGQLVPVAELVEPLRQVKDDDELAAIRAAAALASDALAEVLPTVRLGDREIDIAARLEYALRHRGSLWHPFQTIVASGPRSALPHARSSEREVAAGELLLIDFGAQLAGYCSDITRTVGLRTLDGKQRSVYQLVNEAQRRAREGLRAGMSGRDADALARDLIGARGYGDAFGHSLGHGLGLEVHEAPRLAATADAPLPAGTVVTVEPGIYLPGWGGVRLEDDVWVGPNGPVLLSDGQTDLLVLDC